MAKRFVDSELWDKEWYMELSLKHKCFMRFLFDKCDASGVWSANWILATSYIGEKISEEDIKALGARVRKIGEKKYFLDDFISFQYGNLSPACKPHLKIIGLLEKHNIDSKGYPKGIETLEEKDKEEYKEMEKDKGGLGEKEIIPQMKRAWLSKNPNYPIDDKKDVPALLSIAKFVSEKLEIRFNPSDAVCTDQVLSSWDHLCDHIPKDKFYKNFSLSQIDKNIQSIVLSIQNGSGNSTQQKSNTKVTSSELNEAHSKYFG